MADNRYGLTKKEAMQVMAGTYPDAPGKLFADGTVDHSESREIDGVELHLLAVKAGTVEDPEFPIQYYTIYGWVRLDDETETCRAIKENVNGLDAAIAACGKLTDDTIIRKMV